MKQIIHINFIGMILGSQSLPFEIWISGLLLKNRTVKLFAQSNLIAISSQSSNIEEWTFESCFENFLKT